MFKWMTEQGVGGIVKRQTWRIAKKMRKFWGNYKRQNIEVTLYLYKTEQIDP